MELMSYSKKKCKCWHEQNYVSVGEEAASFAKNYNRKQSKINSGKY